MHLGIAENYARNYISKQKHKRLIVYLRCSRTDFGARILISSCTRTRVSQGTVWCVNCSILSPFFCCLDVVYTITYSIMLLNTDLHLVQISSHSKMTVDLFCENTMSTVLEQEIALDDEDDMDVWKAQLELCLKEIYSSVKNQGVLQPISEDDAPKSFLGRMGSMKQRKKKGSSSSSSEC